MLEPLQAIAPFVVPLLVIALALSIAPAQLAARGVLRKIAGNPIARLRAPALICGVGLGAGLAVFLTAIWFGPEASLLVALLILLALLATIDVAWRWLPWEWCALIAVIGCVQAIISGVYGPMILGALTGGGLLLALRTTYLVLRGTEALGLGDVWLAAAIGAVIGPIHIIWVLGSAACLGLLLHFAAPTLSRTDRGVAFGAHICVATPFFFGL